MRELGGLVLGQVKHALSKRNQTQLGQPIDEPPVVAQLMIEIRADGSRTIARGALNDLRTGESAQVHAEGRTPADLMMSLASSLLALPGSLFDAGSSRRERLKREQRELVNDAPRSRAERDKGRRPSDP